MFDAQRGAAAREGEMEVIAERILTLEVPSGGAFPIRVVLGKPEQVDPNEWITPYEIYGPGASDVWRAHAAGADAMQSLVLALFVLPHELATRVAPLGRLTFEGNLDLGFSHRAD